MYEKIIFSFTIITIAYFGYVLIKHGSPKIYLISILYFLPFMNFLGTKVAFGGFKVFDIITFCSFVYLIRFFFRENIFDKKYFQLLFFCCLILIAITGSIISEHPSTSLIDTLKILPIFIYSRFLILECIQDPSFHNKIINTLKVIYGLALVFLIIQLAVGLKFTFYTVLNINTYDPISGAIRFPGYYNDSQVQGQFFAMGSFIFLYIPQSMPTRKKILNYFLFFMAIVAIYLCGSRSAFLGFAIGLSLLILLIGKKYLVYVILAVLILIPILTYYPNVSGVLSRSKSIGDDLKFRQSIWTEAYKISLKHPFFGIGNGNYEEYTKKHNPNQYFELENNEIMYFDQPENGYLKIIVEFGYLGFLFFALIMITPILNALFLYFINQCNEKIILLISSLVSFLVAFNTVYSLFDYRLLIIVATIIVLLITYPKTQQPSEVD